MLSDLRHNVSKELNQKSHWLLGSVIIYYSFELERLIPYKRLSFTDSCYLQSIRNGKLDEYRDAILLLFVEFLRCLGMRIIAVVGIRSQYIKICSFQRILKNLNIPKQDLDIIYINAGQHYDPELATGFINDLKIYFDKELLYDNNDPLHIFGDMIVKLAELFCYYNNQNTVDYIMCFGDANTTMATAIAASKTGIKLIHVEAGLRLGNLDSPEEGNRVVAEHLSSVLFVSNKADLINIEKEGLAHKSYFAGDIVQDLVNLYSNEHNNRNYFYYWSNGTSLTYKRKHYIVASLHRKENIRDGCLPELFKAFQVINENIIFLAHPTVCKLLSDISYDSEKITIAHYIPYFEMLTCISNCKYMITDSGAFQREAYYLSKRCIIRQDRAFWHHLVDIGVHITTGKKCNDILQSVDFMENLLSKQYPCTDYFGKGNAVKEIISYLLRGNICFPS